MELRDAIDQLAVIRAQLARNERLHSLRAVTVAFSASMACLASALQELFIASPLLEPGRWLLLWLGTAGICALAAFLEMVMRLRQCSGPLERATAWHAWEQFLPSLTVGAVLTVFVSWRLPDQLWLLPGLWQLLFGIACLSAWRLLPRIAIGVGVFYLGTGTACLWLGPAALHPMAMGIPFTIGQLLLATILYLRVERVEVRA